MGGSVRMGVGDGPSLGWVGATQGLIQCGVVALRFPPQSMVGLVLDILNQAVKR